MNSIEDDLRSLYAERVSNTPSGQSVLAWLDDQPRRDPHPRRRRAAIGLAAAAVVVGAATTVAVLDGPADHSAPVGTTTGSGTGSAVPAAAARPGIALRYSFAVVPPAGFALQYGGRIDPQRQVAYLVSAGKHLEQSDFAGISQIVVYDQGAYDPTAARRGQRVDVNGHVGYYATVRELDPLEGPGHLEMASGPAVVWEFAPDTWAVVTGTSKQNVQTTDHQLQSLAVELSIARSVRTGTPTAATVPLRLSYLPAGLGRSYLDADKVSGPSGDYSYARLYFQATARPSLTESQDLRIQLDAFPLIDHSTPGATPANHTVAVGTTPAPNDSAGQVSINGQSWTLVGHTGSWNLSLDTDEYQLQLVGSGSVDRDELLRIARGLSVVAHPSDTETWVDAATAIP